MAVSLKDCPNNDKDRKFSDSIFWDTFTGLLAYAFFFALAASAYIGVFGYGLGHLIHYALAEILSMPISFDTCFTWGLIPILNIIGLLIVVYVLMGKLLLMEGLRLLLWLLDVLPPFLKEWANNLK